VRWLLWAATIGNAALGIALAAAGGAAAGPPRRLVSRDQYRDGTPAYVFLSRDDKWRCRCRSTRSIRRSSPR
jgi:hypothetical protein